MIWAYLCLMLGAVVWFMDGPAQVVTMVLALLCGAMYLRSMGRRARRDVR